MTQSMIIILAILGLHLLLVLVYLIVFALTKRGHLRKEYIVPVVILPIAGAMLAFLIEYLYFTRREGARRVELEDLTLGEDIYWKTLKQSDENINLVPLEEALTINDVTARRRLLLDTMFDDPRKYLDLLAIARQNEDPETTHYATSSISKIQTSFQLELQKSAVEFQRNPQNYHLLDQYIDIMQRYLDSGLLDDFLLSRQRVLLNELLDKKLTHDPHNRRALTSKIHNLTELGRYAEARQVSLEMQEYWPKDENTWLESLRLAVESRDRGLLTATLESIRKTDLIWSRAGLDQISQWMDASIELEGAR